MEKLQAYIGKRVFPIGKTIVLNSGWTTGNDYVCETIVYFEFRGKLLRKAERWNVSKTALSNAQQFFQPNITDEQLLDIFMRDGLELAKANIFGLIEDNFPEQHNLLYPVDLMEYHPINAIMDLRRTSAGELDWLMRQTGSRMIQNIIRVSDGIHIGRVEKL